MKLVMKKKVEPMNLQNGSVGIDWADPPLSNFEKPVIINPMDVNIPSKRYSGKTIGFVLEKKDFSYLKWYYTQSNSKNTQTMGAIKQILENDLCPAFTMYMADNEPEGLKKKFAMRTDSHAIISFLSKNKGKMKRDGSGETFLSKMHTILSKEGYLPDHLLNKVVHIIQTKNGVVSE